MVVHSARRPNRRRPRADATADRQALLGTVTGIAFGLRNTG
jgi:phosphoenolpyruvate carboxylase